MNKLLLAMITAIFTISACSSSPLIPTGQTNICEITSCTDETVADSQESKSDTNLRSRYHAGHSNGSQVGIILLGGAVVFLVIQVLNIRILPEK